MNNTTQNRQSITVQNRTTDCEKLFEILAVCVRSNDIADTVHDDLRLIVEETFTNIASYAYDDDDTQTVAVEINIIGGKVSVTFTDKGVAFNPITDCDRDVENDDHCEGGMGIHIIKSLSDHLQYDRISQRNVFTVTKHYTKQQ